MQFQSLIIGLGLGLFPLTANGLPANGVSAPRKRTHQTSSKYRIPNIPTELGISMVPVNGVNCVNHYDKKDINRIGNLACAEKKLVEKNFTVKLVSVGETYRTNSRFDPNGQKFYIYPLTPLVRGENGIYQPTPYLVINENCMETGVYLRTFLKPPVWGIKKLKYKKCWDGRIKPN